MTCTSSRASKESLSRSSPHPFPRSPRSSRRTRRSWWARSPRRRSIRGVERPRRKSPPSSRATSQRSGRSPVLVQNELEPQSDFGSHTFPAPVCTEPRGLDDGRVDPALQRSRIKGVLKSPILAARSWERCANKGSRPLDHQPLVKQPLELWFERNGSSAPLLKQETRNFSPSII